MERYPVGTFSKHFYHQCRNFQFLLFLFINSTTFQSRPCSYFCHNIFLHCFKHFDSFAPFLCSSCFTLLLNCVLCLIIFCQQLQIVLLFDYFQYRYFYYPRFNIFQFHSNPDSTIFHSGLWVLYPAVYSNCRFFQLLFASSWKLKNNSTVSICSVKGTSAKYGMSDVVTFVSNIK